MKPNTYVYIAGPYTAPGQGGHDWRVYYEIDRHINEARLWATRLAQADIPFFCPHMNSAHMEVLAPDTPPAFWYELDLLFLNQASAVLLLPQWEESTGALIEQQQAIEKGIRCFAYEDFDQLVEYWREG
jgi:hypothetical protein